jgi:hypothetical protein
VRRFVLSCRLGVFNFGVICQPLFKINDLVVRGMPALQSALQQQKHDEEGRFFKCFVML